MEPVVRRDNGTVCVALLHACVCTEMHCIDTCLMPIETASTAAGCRHCVRAAAMSTVCGHPVHC